MDLSDATGKIPATPGFFLLDPGAFRLVAQCLNHYATPGPNMDEYNHLYFPTNALNYIKLIRLKSTCINILKDKNSDMFRILWDPSSGSIKSASLKLLVMFCVRSRCLAA